MQLTNTTWTVCDLNPDWEVCRDGFIRHRGDAKPVTVRMINSSNQRQYRVVQYVHVDSGKKVSVPVSHLVLVAFGPQKPSPKHVALHINGNLTDDRIENLAWVTRSESARLSTEAHYGKDKAAKVRARGGSSVISDAIARRVCKAIKAGLQSYEEIAISHGVSKQFVTQIANGHRRLQLAIEHGLLDDNPILVLHAWPYLERSTQQEMLNKARAAIRKSITG